MPADAQPARHTVTFTLHNQHQTARWLVLEPWGDQHTMEPGAAIQIIAEGPVGESLEIVDGDETLTVWGWSGSVITLFEDGKQLDVAGGPPVPGIPDGMSMRSFLGLVLRGPKDNSEQ